MAHPIYVGTSGWGLPASSRDAFPPEGSTLSRYAARLPATEINSTFYRSHRPATFEGWAAQTPEPFRFAVKAPRELTHKRRLADPREPLGRFLEELQPLRARLGPILIQLPPSLGFDPAAAEAFLTEWRTAFEGPTVLEPRHESWFGQEAAAMLEQARIARVAADPACCAVAREPGGWPGLAYWRWHGSPRMYSSAYPDDRLEALASAVRRASGSAETWCIFDNTMHGAAIAHALRLEAALAG